MTECINIPIEVPADLFRTLNQTEQELKQQFKLLIALMLFKEAKITIGKAIQLAGTTRWEFEKALAKYHIPVAELQIEQVLADVEKLSK